MAMTIMTVCIICITLLIILISIILSIQAIITITIITITTIIIRVCLGISLIRAKWTGLPQKSFNPERILYLL